MCTFVCQTVFAVQGLFAIIEFESEDSAQKALSHDDDILLKSRRLVVRPRRLKQQTAIASDDCNDVNVSTKQSTEDLHRELITKLTNCDNVRCFPLTV